MHLERKGEAVKVIFVIGSIRGPPLEVEYGPVIVRAIEARR